MRGPFRPKEAVGWGQASLLVIKGKNAWVSFAGRCYLVAPEHLRGLAPDENATTRPLIREGLAQLRAASESNDFLDLTS